SRVSPAHAALCAVCSTMLVMMAGNSGSRFGADRFLSTKPLVYLGGISYAVYLWHWPVLGFYSCFNGDFTVGLVAGLGVMAASIALAAISTRLVEAPIRFAHLKIHTPPRPRG